MSPSRACKITITLALLLGGVLTPRAGTQPALAVSSASSRVHAMRIHSHIKDNSGCPPITIGDMEIDLCSIAELGDPSTLDVGASAITVDVSEVQLVEATPTALPPPTCPPITISDGEVDLCSVSEPGDPSTLDPGATAIVIDVQEISATATAAPTAPPSTPVPTSAPTQVPVLTSAPTQAPVLIGSNPPPATSTSVPAASSTSVPPAPSTPPPPASTAMPAPAGTATYVPTQTPIPGGSTGGAATSTPAATDTSAATIEPTETATQPTTAEVHNAPRTVKGGRKPSCDLITNLQKLSQGCEIISSISAPGASVVYTLAYPGANGLRQTFTDTADSRGHSLHIFTVPYLPPVGAKHGSLATVVRVTVVATLSDGTALQPGGTRFTVIR